MKKSEVIDATVLKVKKFLQKNYQTRSSKKKLTDYQISRHKEPDNNCIQLTIIKKHIQIDTFTRKHYGWREQNQAAVNKKKGQK